MIVKIVAVVLLLAPVLLACSDRFRDPCGYVREATTTTFRTKNKALGWVPPSTIYYGPSTEPAYAEKC